MEPRLDQKLKINFTSEVEVGSMNSLYLLVYRIINEHEFSTIHKPLHTDITNISRCNKYT